jgi:hypothetical protein
MIRKSLILIRVIKSQVEITKKGAVTMTVDKHTQIDAMFRFLPSDADRCHATRLLMMLRSHGIRDTREVLKNEWVLLVERLMEQVLPA